MGISSLLNLPIQLLMPSSFSPIKEISLKTIPSASKIDIKRVLEGRYGIEVEKVRTLNMKGKKKNGGWFFTVKPNYKKAYVTLKRPLSTSQIALAFWIDNKDGSGRFEPEKSSGSVAVVVVMVLLLASKFPWSSMLSSR
ncbi:hypothetical protein Vadar_019267 [Vaccinium darrowii]|uniref:Uncharacterized protein n=1 Tax=Vaccinium darrowii TaxID=229202 RepID=A0ACB7Z6C5_9ERIC|nr:hypothetical protein Vadar_019267 [Vaccinium darrowii]